MSFRLCAIDLDGTLLHSRDHAITPASAAAVERLAARDVRVVLASGRRYATIQVFALQLNLPPDTPLIAYNGAMIRTVGGDLWFHRPVPAPPAERIVRICQAEGYHLNYYLNDELYIRQETRWSRLYRRRTGSVPHVIGDLTRLDGSEPTKLLLIDSLEVTDALLPRFYREFGRSLYITKTEDEYLEFMHPEVHKGDALARIAGRLGIAPEETVAFGDSYNDLSMLSWAGLGVAVANARPELKEVAGRIAPPADEDGVARALDDLFADD